MRSTSRRRRRRRSWPSSTGPPGQGAGAASRHCIPRPAGLRASLFLQPEKFRLEEAAARRLAGRSLLCARRCLLPVLGSRGGGGRRREGTMSTSLEQVNGTKTATEDADKMVNVNITINQESSLSYLVKAVAAIRRQKPARSSAAAAPTRGQCSGEQKVLGGAQILLGVVCISLGVVMTLQNTFIWAVVTGAPFWMGSLFIVSGTFSAVGERRGGIWVAVATFFNLGSVLAGSLGLAYGVANMPCLNCGDYEIDNLCQRQRGYQEYHPWWATPTPSPSPTYDWRVEQCKATLANLMLIAGCVRILLLIFSIVALLIAIFSFGYGVRALCCCLRTNCDDYVLVADPEMPPPYEDPEKEKTAT